MRRPALVAIVVAVAAVALWTLTARPALPPASSAEAAEAPAAVGGPSDSTPEVTVEQQLVRATVTDAKIAEPRKPASVAKRNTPRKEGFFARARRVLFGGGRHKPSPFPAAQ